MELSLNSMVEGVILLEIQYIQLKGGESSAPPLTLKCLSRINSALCKCTNLLQMHFPKTQDTQHVQDAHHFQKAEVQHDVLTLITSFICKWLRKVFTKTYIRKGETVRIAQNTCLCLFFCKRDSKFTSTQKLSLQVTF